MNSAAKEKNERPSSNFQEEAPKGKVPSGDHAVKQPEDEDYTKEEPDFKDIAERKENQEQPVNPIKTPPSS
jgi:ABC-type uncharacterized transport system involved in gliding motility auxiliary subunit